MGPWGDADPKAQRGTRAAPRSVTTKEGAERCRRGRGGAGALLGWREGPALRGLWAAVWQILRKSNREPPSYSPAGCRPPKCENRSSSRHCQPMLLAAEFATAGRRKEPRRPRAGEQINRRDVSMRWTLTRPSTGTEAHAGDGIFSLLSPLPWPGPGGSA